MIFKTITISSGRKEREELKSAKTVQISEFYSKEMILQTIQEFYVFLFRHVKQLQNQVKRW